MLGRTSPFGVLFIASHAVLSLARPVAYDSFAASVSTLPFGVTKPLPVIEN